MGPNAHENMGLEGSKNRGGGGSTQAGCVFGVEGVGGEDRCVWGRGSTQAGCVFGVEGVGGEVRCVGVPTRTPAPLPHLLLVPELELALYLEPLVHDPCRYHPCMRQRVEGTTQATLAESLIATRRSKSSHARHTTANAEAQTTDKHPSPH